MEKVDVIINVFGKPWQTLCTLKSLMKYCWQHIDKIYFIEEKKQPYNDSVKFILNEFDNIEYYMPESYTFLPKINNRLNYRKKKARYLFRYQYGIENSDKKFVFITHNDVLYTDDIIGDMLLNIKNNVGIGLIGQCWNCPAYYANLCESNKFYEYNPTFSEVVNLCIKHKPKRKEFISLINKEKPMPLPECRLNEFSCLINREITVNECYPNKKTPFFGEYSGIDLGQSWFRDMIIKGYKFKNYDIGKKSVHMFFAKDAGYQVQMDIIKYFNSEDFAKDYYNSHFK